MKKLVPILLLLICLLSISFAAANNNANDVGNFTELQSDIEKSYSSGVLNLEKNYKYDVEETTLKNGVIINQTIIINGNNHTIDGSNIARIFNITGDNVVLNNITFINGNSTGNGGALYIANPVALKCNPATYDDPVTYTITIKNCLFENNTAKNGGALYTYIMKSNILNSEFNYNKATSPFGEWLIPSGGGAFCAESNDRDTRHESGYVYWGDFVNITDCKFNSNEALNSEGGAFYIWRSKISNFTNVTFENNKAWRAGAIMVQGSLWISNKLNLYDCKCINNSATNMIGVIYYGYASDSIIKNTYFINNHAEKNSAAIYGSDTINITIENCTFEDNEIISDGAGAIYFKDAQDTIINNCKFNKNKGDFGGAIYLCNKEFGRVGFERDYSYFTLKNSYFKNNTANYGGAIYIEQRFKKKLVTLNATFDNLTFKNNKAYNTGGAIYSLNLNNLTIKNSIFLYDLSNEIFTNHTNTSITTSIFASKEENPAIYNNHKLIIDYSIFDCITTIENTGNLTANYNFWNDNKANFTKLIKGTYTINNYVIIDILGKNSTEAGVKTNYTAIFILNDTSKLNKNLPDFNVTINSTKGIINPLMIIITKNKGNFTLISYESTTINIINLNKKVLVSKFINISTPEDSLTALNLLINGNSNNRIIKLNINYRYYEGIDDAFINGISIIDQVTIDGNHHYISAEYTTFFFNIAKTGSLTLINTDLIRPEEIAIVNNGELTLENVTTTGKIVNNGKIKNDIVFTIISKGTITTYDSFIVTLKTQDGVNIEMNTFTFKDDKNHTFKPYIYDNGIYVCYVPEGVTGHCTFNDVSITGYDKITTKGSLDIIPYQPKKINKNPIIEKLYNKVPTVAKIQNKISDIQKPIINNINILFSNLKSIFNKRLA